MSAVPHTLPRLAGIDLDCVIEQLRSRDADESADFAHALARAVRRRDPWTVLRYYARVRAVGARSVADGVVPASLALECANLCARDFARALLMDRLGVADALERQGRDWSEWR